MKQTEWLVGFLLFKIVKLDRKLSNYKKIDKTRSERKFSYCFFERSSMIDF